MPVPTTLNDASSWLASIGRLGRGLAARKDTRQPEKPLELYEFEACPFCRKVREAMSELDLSYVSHPCARGSAHRDEVVSRGGKAQFPYLVDPNTGTEMYESEAIIDYLRETYGPGKRSPLSRAFAPLNTLGAGVVSAMRPRGRKSRRAGQTPDEPLVLYNFEASPYCRKVRETLCELDLVCEVRNVGKGSPRRRELIERGGKMMVPYLVDPNTGAEMYESDDIVRYLEQTWGGAP